MPQPKKAGSAPEDPRTGLDALRDLLLLPRDRVRETLDDAVRRGRITRADAEELIDRLFEVGRAQRDDVLSRLEGIVPGGATVGKAVRTLDRRSKNEFPIDDYDELTAAKITGQLDELAPVELREVLDYEKRNANRKSVLAAVEKRLR